jgi:hypothetical protein
VSAKIRIITAEEIRRADLIIKVVKGFGVK